MAPEMSTIYVYDKTGNTLLFTKNIAWNMTTIGELLEMEEFVNNNITEISNTVGGQPLSHEENPSYFNYYDVSPDTTETITGFYLDGTEYKFEGGGTAEGITTTQPSNPVAGSTYYDATNKVVKVYNGTAWEEVGGGNVIAMTQAEYEALPEATKNDGKLRIITDAPQIEIQTGGNYTAGNGIDITNDEIGLDGTYEGIGEGKDYSAMQGPAPSGFHVPKDSELYTLYRILTTTFGLAKSPTTLGTYLKMPMAGRRDYSYSSVERVGTLGNYWCSNGYSDSNAHSLTFYSSSISIGGDSRAKGLSIRCFKDTPVIPTSSWTTLYNGSSVASGAGVFWNSTDGLISVSGDGQNWYTIQDKNLGATAVYNEGDTVNDTNSGYFYQRGNNYGFPHSGTVTTSSTQVDASSYGPGNYYNSNTFIIGKSDRSSVLNNNLWGGVTGVQPIIISGNLIIGDKLYKIVTSTTAPASGTSSNIITIVTD